MEVEIESKIEDNTLCLIGVSVGVEIYDRANLSANQRMLFFAMWNKMEFCSILSYLIKNNNLINLFPSNLI